MIRIFAAAALAGLAATSALAQEPPIAPKVLVITMFSAEAKPWLDGEALTRKIDIPGLFKTYPTVGCSEGGLCAMTTGMGYANAASSASALAFSGRLRPDENLRHNFGHRGRRPRQGHARRRLSGARFAVDVGLQNEIDARETARELEFGLSRDRFARSVKRASSATKARFIGSTRRCSRPPFE